MRRLVAVCLPCVVSMTAIASRAAAQTPPPITPDVFVGIGVADLGPSKVDLGPPFATLGGGMTLRVHHRFGIGFELNRMLGTATRRRDVAGDVTPTGELRQGPTSLTFASAKGFYYLFSNQRVQAYVGAGLAAVWERGVSPDYDSHPPVEQAYSINDTGPTITAGLRIAVTSRIGLRPEFENLAGRVQRACVAVAYQF